MLESKRQFKNPAMMSTSTSLHSDDVRYQHALDGIRAHRSLNTLAAEQQCSPDDIVHRLLNPKKGATALRRVDLTLLDLARIELRHNELLELLAQGVTYGDIAEKFGVSSHLISRYILKHDLPARSRGFPRGKSREPSPQQKKQTEKRVQQALKMREQGSSLAEIADHLGLKSRERARQILATAGAASALETIAVDRTRICTAIAPYLTKGFDVPHISETLQKEVGLHITIPEIRDVIRVARERYYENIDQQRYSTWNIDIAEVKKAMALVRDAFKKQPKRLMLLDLERIEVRHEELLELLAQGVTYGDIAEKFGVSSHLISRYILKHDLPARSRGFPRGKNRGIKNVLVSQQVQVQGNSPKRVNSTRVKTSTTITPPDSR